MNPEIGVSALNPPPSSNNTVRVRMIDTTSIMSLHAFSFVKPVMPGHERMSVTTVAFLIENERLGKKAMFDLGTRKDYWNSPPFTLTRIEAAIPGVRVDKDVTEILQAQGLKLSEIDDIIWSHSHWDHMGSPYLFPSSTNLCYGKGTGPFPAYPENSNSNLNAADFEGRNCIEIGCTDLYIGPFPATDFYGDGSLYLLDTPGHWPGHLCALARTTPDTFVFLGGDICHFAGDFRPSEAIPFPEKIPGESLLNSQKYPAPCPCEFFLGHHPQLREVGSSVNTKTTPFYQLSTHEHSTYKDPATAVVTTEGMQKYFDADPNIMVCLAHDTALLDHLPIFNHQPEKDINDWKNQGLKERCHWGWLGELPRYDKDGNLIGPGNRDIPIVDGLWRDGIRVDSFRN
ncbi:hypothetical protein N7462_002091 [Penicillium macrosclerotiorum]|uniref:uncharacterized protein n=1 Tax=Penicillium macrosclerotiorum TaxID=303699 RepID=UPI002546C6FC|nr:uncharacterized protein N7462_002091 [Penicillium macrosclerotiorum]KAJ5692668.1 hypothetical protein N7462_002091 [Penicillium macrosclerotiorum]